MASDPCIFKNGSNLVVLYVDDCVILSRTKEEADRIFIGLNNKGYKMTDEGTMEQYIGILFTNNSDGSFRISQPNLINRIIDSIPAMKDTRRAITPVQSEEVLTKDVGDQPRKDE